ncbi:MAG: hypothetical protein FJ395_10655 [Verrucomicrobia bacterium]|nr:hypothetical protein [Verrucomicrobiota bacterium]
MNANKIVSLCSVAAVLTLGSGMLVAQDNTPPQRPPGGEKSGDRNGDRDRGRSRFDPAEIQKRISESIKDRLGFKDDEWTVVQPLVQKVMDLRRDTLIGGLSGFRFGSRPSSDGKSSSKGSSEGSRSPWFTPSPEAEALQKAIDDNAPAAQVKAALDKYRASRKDKEAQLAAAQEDLRKVLTARQEAQATLMGMLP